MVKLYEIEFPASAGMREQERKSQRETNYERPDPTSYTYGSVARNVAHLINREEWCKYFQNEVDMLHAVPVPAQQQPELGADPARRASRRC